MALRASSVMPDLQPARRMVDLPAWLPIAAAAVIALLLSTQFLFQPFIWRNFSMPEIMGAWLAILRDRLVVAVPIALALGIGWRLPVRRGAWSVLWHVVAVAVGAIAGEWLIDRIDPEAAGRAWWMIAGEVARWTLIGVAAQALLSMWRTAVATEIDVNEARGDVARLRRLAAIGRIEALNRQIEPHFLFNTLATIRSLHRVDAAGGQDLLRDLLTLVSRTLGARQESVATLGGEIELVRAYLGVCGARLSGALAVRCEVPEALLAREVPPLALSTLAENAIKHGVAPRGGGIVTIRAEERDGGLAVELYDDGVGIGASPGGSGIGLANVGERLRLLYGPAARLELAARPEGGVRAGFWIPDRKAAA